MRNLDPQTYTRLKVLHIAFIAATLSYLALGFILKEAKVLSTRAMIPEEYAMLWLLPGIIMALAGITFYRRAADGREGVVSYYMIGNALVEGLAINPYSSQAIDCSS